MNENYFDEFIQSTKLNPKKSLGTALDEFYESKKDTLFSNAQQRMTKDSFRLRQARATLGSKTATYLSAPGQILEAQLGLYITDNQLTPPEPTEDRQKEIAALIKTKQLTLAPLELDQLTTPLAINFARLALEQLLLDYHTDLKCDPSTPHWSGFKYDTRGSSEGFSTICCLSNFLRTWENQSPQTKSASFLKINTHYLCAFSSFKDLEEDWVSPLILDLQLGGIDKAKQTILRFSNGCVLTPSQIDWIIERVRHYFPDDELIEALQLALSVALLQENVWINPLLSIMNSQDKAAVDCAEEKIKQNLKLLESDDSLRSNSTKFDNYQILLRRSLIAHLAEKDTCFNKNQTIITLLRTIFNFFDSKDQRKFIVHPAPKAQDNPPKSPEQTKPSPLVDLSFLGSSSRHISKTLLAAKLTPANEAIAVPVEETQATSLKKSVHQQLNNRGTFNR